MAAARLTPEVRAQRRAILGRWAARTCPASLIIVSWLRSELAYELWRRTHPYPETYSEHWWVDYLDGAGI